MTASFGAVIGALLLASSGVLVTLINRSDRHIASRFVGVDSRLDAVERRLERLENKVDQGFANLSLRIDGLYGRSA